MSSEIQDPLINQQQQQNPSINQNQDINVHQQNHHNVNYQHNVTEQHHEYQTNRVLVASEFRQSGNQPEDEEPQTNISEFQMKNIDQWVRIIPCSIVGSVSAIICIIFLAYCDLTQVSVYLTSGVVLVVLPYVLFYDLTSKFFNFIAFFISFYFMVVLAIYADEQRYQNLDDKSFYQQHCFKENDTSPHEGLSYGFICLLGLTMCLLHTVNTVYYFSQVWIHSSHNIKQKIENYTIELI